MNTITIILLVSAALLVVSVICLIISNYDRLKLVKSNTELRKANIELRHENAARRSNQDTAAKVIKEMKAELADLKAKAQTPKAAPIPDKVRVSNVIQSVTRYTGRSYAEVAAELRLRYPSEKIGLHWYYDRTQAEAIREIYKPKKSNK